MTDLSVSPLLDRWERLMRSFPSDGWDGAAALIGRHDRTVCELERRMDREIPGWRDESVLPYRPRTQPHA